MTRNLTLFDLDYTLLPIDSEFEWINYLIRSGHFDRTPEAAAHLESVMARYHAGTLADADYVNFVYGFLASQPRTQIDAWHADYMQTIVAPALRSEARDLVAAHQKAGDLCAIVTGSSQFITEPIGHALGVETVLGTLAEEVDGRFTGKIIGEPCFGKGKITHVDAWLARLGQRWEDFPHTTFYSDSTYDLPLLSRVHEAVATNPNPRLRAIADERGWRILALFP